MSVRASWLAVLVLGLSGLVGGCGSTVIENTPDPDDNDPLCPASEPGAGSACDPDGVECAYSHEPDEECVYAYQCAEGAWLFTDESGGGCEEQCLADPTCAPGEEQLASCEGIDPLQLDCHSVTACGSTIYCAISTCDLPPSCDPGDTQTTGECPPTGCYQATSCGSSIFCVDNALPQHGCPAVEPSGGEACDAPHQICDYDTGDGCFSSYACDDSGTWTFAGGGCKGDG